MLRLALLLGLTSPALAQPKAAQRCPEGKVVVGLEADGTIICEAPPRRRAPPLRPRPKVEPFPVDAQGRVVVPHARFKGLLAEPSLLARTARVVPHYKDGKFQGFRVFAIRRGSLPAALGLRNGDTIHTVGGHSLAGLKEAMAAFVALEKLPPNSAVKITGRRRGQPLDLTVFLTSEAQPQPKASPGETPSTPD